jgi:hypothetical protein
MSEARDKRTYTVKMRDGSAYQVSAEDVDLTWADGSNSAPYFNFQIDLANERTTTVAAFPFELVASIQS